MKIISQGFKHPILGFFLLLLFIISCKKEVTPSSKLEKAPKIDKVDTVIIDSSNNKTK